MNLETVKNNINELVDSNPNLIMDIEYFLKEKKAYFKKNGIKYGYRGYAGFKPKQESEDIAKPEPSDKAGRRSMINKEVVEAIKNDPQYSTELLRLVKDIRRAQRGKTSNLSDEDRDFFLDNKDKGV